MVKKRNRKAETTIDTNLSSPGTGTHYFATTLPNSFGYTDGFASSVWPMGTKVEFHNTGSSQGGDFGELNKLNYDNQIELYTPDTWRYKVASSHFSASYAQIGHASGGIHLTASTTDGRFIGSYKYNYAYAIGETIPTPQLPQPNWRNAIDFSQSADYFIPERQEGFIEFQFTSSMQGDAQSEARRGLAMFMVRDGVLYSGSAASGGMPTAVYGMETWMASASLGLFLGDLLPRPHTGLGSFPTDISTLNSLRDTFSCYVSGVAGTNAAGNLTNLIGISHGPRGIGTGHPDFTFSFPGCMRSQLNDRYFRIYRQYDPSIYGEWIWKFQTKLEGQSWQTFGQIETNDVEDLLGTDKTAELFQQSFRGVLAFEELFKMGSNTSSCVEPRVQSISIKEFDRSAYSSHPTASTTYCYPAGFITNDGAYPVTTDSMITDSYKLNPYKDYGLFWNVSEERKNVIGEERYPSHNSYDEFSSDIRYMAKEYSIIPEYRISEHIEDMLNQTDPAVTNYGFLELDGAEITSSGEGYFDGVSKAAGTNLNFYKDYSDSDFQSDLDTFSDQYLGLNSPVSASMDSFTISCDAILKLLPYDGFYPISRTNQLASLFSSSLDISSSAGGYNIQLLKYSPNEQGWVEILQQSTVEEDYISSPRLRGIKTQGASTPFFGPGILYNSIKSGISLGWTIVTGSSLLDTYSMWNTNNPENPFVRGGWDENSSLRHIFLNTNLYNNPDSATKINFEALWDLSRYPRADLGSSDVTAGGFHVSYPEALQGYFSSSIGDTSDLYSTTDYFMVRMKDVPDPKYEMAMNNFLAESVRFFLRDRVAVDTSKDPNLPGELSSLRSKTATQIKASTNKPILGATYYMDVIVEMNPSDYTMCESYYNKTDDNLAYYSFFEASNSSGKYSFDPDNANFAPPNSVINFSCSFNGRYFGPATQKWDSYWNKSEPVSGAHYNVADPAQAPFTPPYYYGSSRVTLEYTVGDEWSDLNKDVFSTLFSKITASYYNPGLESAIAEGNINASLGKEYLNTASFAYVMAQNVGDSLDLLGASNIGEIGSGPSGQTISNVYVPEATRWVIAPKWECPVLDFKDQQTSKIAIQGGLHPTCSFSASSGFLDNHPIGTGRGMWSGYGKEIASDKGLRIRLAESPQHNATSILPGLTPETKRTYDNSLLNLMGFREASGGESEVYAGKLATYRSLKEAVVAIPFLERIVESGKELAETTNDTDSYGEFFSDRFFFPVRDELIFDAQGEPQYNRNDSISEMLNNMRDFVIPSEFDFINNRLARPIVMYIMPFETILDKTDLQDIWQGVLPRIGVQAQEKTGTKNTTISHPLNSENFFEGKKIPTDIKWMVFRVKQSSESDYSKVTPNMMDAAGQTLTTLGQTQGRLYSYNWPYDFCSLIELGKIQTSFKIKK